MSNYRRIVDLINASFGRNEILDIVKCSTATFYRARTYHRQGLPIPSAKGKHPGGRPKAVATPQACRRLRDSIKRHPRRSLREHGRRLQIADRTLRRMAGQIGAHSRIRIRKPLLTPKMRQRRVELSQKMLNSVKSYGKRIIFFSDEKNFNVQEAYNRRNSRYIVLENSDVEDGGGDNDVDVDADGVPYNVKYATSTKNPASVMFLGVVASTGEVSPPYWFKEKERLNAVKYVKILDRILLPWMAKVAADHPVGPDNVPSKFVFQQDGASSHTAKLTQAFLKKRLGKSGFWRAEMWPANSPDLNPLDYSIWNAVASKACAVPHENTKTLKAAVNRAWRGLSPTYVQSTCKIFRKRLEKVIANNGSIIE